MYRIAKLLPCRSDCSKQDYINFNYTNVNILSRQILPFLPNPSPCYAMTNDLVLKCQAQNVADIRLLSLPTQPPSQIRTTLPPNIRANISNQAFSANNIISNLSKIYFQYKRYLKINLNI